jgi:hypothetical protein
MQDQRHEPDTASLDREDVSTADLAGRDDTHGTAGVARDQEPRPERVSGRDEGDERTEPLFPPQETQELRDHWHSIQAGFVDEPRKAVEAADGLVASAMKRLAEIFASERDRLEAQWDRGDDVNTEDLRIALRRYRSFFDRLLSM